MEATPDPVSWNTQRKFLQSCRARTRWHFAGWWRRRRQSLGQSSMLMRNSAAELWWQEALPTRRALPARRGLLQLQDQRALPCGQRACCQQSPEWLRLRCVGLWRQALQLLQRFRVQVLTRATSGKPVTRAELVAEPVVGRVRDAAAKPPAPTLAVMTNPAQRGSTRRWRSWSGVSFRRGLRSQKCSSSQTRSTVWRDCRLTWRRCCPLRPRNRSWLHGAGGRFRPGSRLRRRSRSVATASGVNPPPAQAPAPLLAPLLALALALVLALVLAGVVARGRLRPARRASALTGASSSATTATTAGRTGGCVAGPLWT